jgi:hypothetical protein
MLVILAMICIGFFAYALTFDKISDAVPASIKRSVAQKPTSAPTNDPT